MKSVFDTKYQKMAFDIICKQRLQNKKIHIVKYCQPTRQHLPVESRERTENAFKEKWQQRDEVYKKRLDV